MPKPAVRFNVHRLTVDLANRGLAATDLARLAGVSDKTVSRFLRSETQTPTTAKKLADALGYSVRRYVIPVRLTQETSE